MKVVWHPEAIKDMKKLGLFANGPMYYLWYAPKRKLEFLWYSRITKVTFRIKRGFWPDAVWSLDDTIAKFVVPRLKYLREVVHGYPAGLAPDVDEDGNPSNDKGAKIWDKYLRRMIWSFEWAAGESGPNDEKIGWWATRYLKDDVYRARVDKRYEEGMRLFATYFASLWD